MARPVALLAALALSRVGARSCASAGAAVTPDNGFGTKANSASFLLRLYLVKPRFAERRGGAGDVEMLDTIQLADPDGRIPFALTRSDRLLTGSDFDPESVRIARDGTLWFGEEFGPYLLHTDARGKVLEAPISLPDVRSPDFPGVAPGDVNLARSNGFEGMALSADGRTLYPVLEGPVTGDDPAVRRVYAFDLRSGRYTRERWAYRVADPSLLVSDFTVLDGRRFVALERDNFEGAAARHKQGFVVELAVAARPAGGPSSTCCGSPTRSASPRAARGPATSGSATPSRCRT